MFDFRKIRPVDKKPRDFKWKYVLEKPCKYKPKRASKIFSLFLKKVLTKWGAF